MSGSDPSRVVKLTVAYDGTAYAGWQRQANGVSVQEVLQTALSDLFAEPTVIVGAGRTDAGVHARGQVASFRTGSKIPPRGVMGGTNARLPDDVAVVRAEDAPAGVHARRDATGKLYRYVILNRSAPSPLDRFHTHRVAAHLDEGRMASAAALLTGRHDFSSFRNAGSVEGSAVRTLRRLDIDRSGEYISISPEGDGFLYRMVRNLVGTLLVVGRGDLEPQAVAEILEARDRRRAGPAAPARGLSLVEVYY